MLIKKILHTNTPQLRTHHTQFGSVITCIDACTYTFTRNAYARTHTHKHSILQTPATPQKADGNINYAALVEEYGPEGADHMVQIIKMKREKAERTAGFVMPPRRHAPKQKIPKQDIEAVNALPGDDNEDNS